MMDKNMDNSKVLGKYEHRDICFDFLAERRGLRYFVAHAIVRKPKSRYVLNLIYVGFVFLLDLYFQIMAIMAAYVTIGNTVVMINALHTALCLTIALSFLTCVAFNFERLEEASRMLRIGVYTYEREEVDEEHLEIRKKGVGTVRKLCDGYAIFLIVNGFLNTVFLAGVRYFFLTEDTSKEALDPYIPQPFYMPFDTRTPTGYFIANLLCVVYIVYLGALIICADDYYLSCTIQLRDQFRILNHSFLNIEKRVRYVHGNSLGLTTEELYKTKEFQDCMYDCLRRNCVHHHTILRFKTLIEKYTGGVFLSVVYVYSVIMAANICLILENPGAHVIVGFSATIMVEVFYALVLCWFGEQIRTESGNVFDSLYSTPWIHCDIRCRKFILFMMKNTKEPVSIKTPLLNFKACLETFSNVISAIYSLMNLLRHT